MFTKKSKEFKVWAKNGKYFLKESLFSRTKEITKEEFQNFLNESKITSLNFKEKNVSLEFLQNHYNKHVENQSSEFGRRVKVVLVEGNQSKSTIEGVDTYFKLDILDESTEKSFDGSYLIETTMKGITGPLTEKGVYYPEAFRALYQLAFNGILATEEDFIKVQRALNE